MRDHDVGVVPVADGDRLLGLVTDRDLVVRVLAEQRDPEEVRVGDVATASPVTVTPDMQLSEARELMGQHQVRRLPVMKGDELVGILSIGDVAMADASMRAVGESLADVSTSPSTMERAGGPESGTPERAREPSSREPDSAGS
jgi:signal-transduction protein with cAMP-binding, CBS, and nucleotidyltransferase domain